MSYTKRQRHQIAEAFKAAKKRLWDGRGNDGVAYICYALNMSNHHGAGMARSVVEARLGRHVTLGVWLHCVAGVKESQLTARRLQRHRHAWLDKLIAEFSE